MLQTIIDTALNVRAQFVQALDGINSARALRRSTIAILHDACVAFVAQAASRFRKHPTLRGRIKNLPKQDMSFQQTMARADEIAALWADLPLVGKADETMGQFTVGMDVVDVTLADFTQMRAAARTSAHDTIPTHDQTFQSAGGALRLSLEEMDDFITSAFKQGRSQYRKGTQPRELIEATPHAAPQSAPAKAQITKATKVSPSTVRLIFAAAHGTSFDVLHRLAGEVQWATIAEDIIKREFEATGLPAGNHEFAVTAHNSRGSGEQSDGVMVMT